MAITPPPTPPNTGDPAFLEQRADAFFGWFPTFVSQFNAELPFISSKSWATYGGSANAITLTAGYVALVRGTQVRFRATAANTGAATINLDGLGARQCRTITGAVLPPGYIRTDVDTEATYDGTYWVVDRQIEQGSNANGTFARLAVGTQICTHTGIVQVLDTQIGGISYTTDFAIWTFPAAFADTPAVSCAPRAISRWAIAYANNGASANYRQAGPGGSSSEASSMLFATGRWY